MTTKEKEKIILDNYKSGLSYREINEKFGFSNELICKVVKGLRSLSEASRLYRLQGKGKLTESGRKILSENGRRVCINSGKFWTKPERQFREILLEIGIGVKYPDYIKEIKKVDDDKFEKTLCYQYPIQRYVLDFVDIERKVAININGDYWHSNPLLYDRNSLGKLQTLNLKQDKNKRVFLEKHGWKVLDIWESEIYWDKELVKEKIRAVSLTEKHVVYTDKSGVQLPHCLPDWSETLRKLWFKTDRVSRSKRKLILVICGFCRKEFETIDNGKRTHKYCSQNCSHKNSRKVVRPSKEELDTLLKHSNIYAVSKKYGVSWHSVKKWISGYNCVTGSSPVPPTISK